MAAAGDADNGGLRVLVVDDSALERRILRAILEKDPRLTVVGTAPDPMVAREKIKLLNPDVITLDVEMPYMNGLTFLSNLMRLRPMPVVMVSSHTASGAEIAIRALEMGAVDAVAKPNPDDGRTLTGFASELCDKVCAAGAARLPYARMARPAAPPAAPGAGVAAAARDPDRLVAIGASTGGVEALRTLFETLPANGAAYVIAQHIPASFSVSLTQRLDGVGAVRVHQAENGGRILAGHAYLAPGGRHLRVRARGTRLSCVVSDDEAVNRHRPSVDVLFKSVCEALGERAVGVLLTGMGSDGARGLAALRACGAHTIAQDEASSVVWGMPGAAVRMEAAVQVLALEDMAACLGALAVEHAA